jgi:hypothetical protein
MGYSLKYKVPGPVCASFIKSRPAAMGETLPVDCLIGPIGSGKSAGTAIRLFLHACEQPRSADGWRRTRWAVLRNTFDELRRTTIPGWLEWFPEEHFGPMNWTPPFRHTIRLPDLKVEMEVWFVPVDNADAVKKLLSWNLTGGWINEAREVPREVVIALRSRCGRYPSLKDLAEPTRPGWAGVIMDTNAPEDELHYLCMWAGWTEPPEWMDNATRAMMTKPDEVNIFVQPPGLLVERDSKGGVKGFKPNPKAENLKNLRPGYYQSQLSGNLSAWVLNMVCCEIRKASDVRLVYPSYVREVHVAGSKLEWDPKKRLLVGMDFARNPAVVVAQEDDELRVLREWIGVNVDVAAFVRDKVVPEMNQLFPGWEQLSGWGDPAGSGRTGGDEKTSFQHAREGGLALVPAWTNDPDERQRAVTRRLERRNGILISPVCTTLIGGFNGGYRFERLKVEGTLDQYRDAPQKNLFSHVHDALQALVLGIDRGSRQTNEMQRQAARSAGPLPNGRVKVDPLALARAARRGR